MLTNDPHLLFKDSSAAVVSKYKEIPNGAFSSVKIFVEAPCQIVGLEYEKYDPRNFAQQLHEL